MSLASASSSAFFVTGGTLSTNAASYVVRRADTDLYDALTESQFCYVLNTRQMGKSSLMVRTAKRLRAEGVTVAVLDLTAIGQNLTVEQWYDGLLLRLAEATDCEDDAEDYFADNERVGAMQRFFDALRKVILPTIKTRLVVFVDEIDAVRSLPFSTDEFFAGVRECYNHRATDPVYEKIAFCLLGVATPADLIQNTRVSPFNIGRRVVITDFTQAEAAPLAQGLGDTGDAVLRRIFHWTNGHPYLTQRLCRECAAANVSDDAGVDALAESLFLSRKARETDDNLSFVRNRLLKSEYPVADVLDFLHRVRITKRGIPDDEANPLCAILRLSGVCKTDRDTGLLRVRNRIYDTVFDNTFIRENMPDAEVRRQKVAVARARWQIGSVAAAALAVFAGLFVQMLVSRRAERIALNRSQRETGRANELLYIANLTLADGAMKAGDIKRVGGLLSDIESNPDRGWEWHYLQNLCHKELRTIVTGDRVREFGAYKMDGNSNPVDCARAFCLSADGNYLAYIETSERIVRYDLRTGERFVFRVPKRNAPKEITYINSLWLSPRGDRVRFALGNGDICETRQPKNDSDNLQAHVLLHWKLPKPDAELQAWTQFSPDGKFLAIIKHSEGQEQGFVQIWDIARNKLNGIVNGMGQKLFCFSSDGKYFAVSDPADRINLYNTQTGAFRYAFKPSESLASVSWWQIQSFEANGFPFQITPQFHSQGFDLEQSPIALTKNTESEYRADMTSINPETGEPNVYNSVEGGYYFVNVEESISGNEGGVKVSRLTLNGEPGGAHLNTIKSATSVAAVGMPSRIGLFSEVPLLVMALDTKITTHIWRPGAQSDDSVLLRGHADPVIWGTFLPATTTRPAGRYAVTVSRTGVIKVWDIAAAKPYRTAFAGNTVSKIAVLPNNANAVFVNASQVRRYDITTGGEKELFSIGEDDTIADIMATSDDSCLVVTKTASGKTENDKLAPIGVRWRRFPETQWHDIPLPAYLADEKIRFVACTISSSGRYIAVATREARTGTDLLLWDTQTERAVQKWTVPKGFPNFVKFAPKGDFVCLATADGTIHTWDTRTFDKRESFLTRETKSSQYNRGRCGVFSSDGKRFLWGTRNGSVLVFDVATRKKLATLVAHTGGVGAVAVSPDGSRYATVGGTDDTVRVWNARTNRELLVLTDTDEATAVAFTPTGYLLTGGQSGLRIWDGTNTPTPPVFPKGATLPR